MSLRGVSSNSVEGGLQPSVNVVMDGVPTARPAEFITDLADIERVEVLSGPQGTLFGKNSTAGVINIVTKRPTRELTADFEGTATDDQQYIGRAVLNTPLSDKAALRINGYYDYLTPLAKNLFPGTNSDLGEKNYGVQGKLLYDISDGTDFLLTLNYNRLQSSWGQSFQIEPNSGLLGELQRATFGPLNYGRSRDPLGNHDGSTWNYAKTYAFIGELNSDLGKGFKLTSVTGYRSFRNDNNNDVDNGPFGGTIDANGVLHRLPNPQGYPIEAFMPPDFLTEVYKYWSEEIRLAYSNDRLDAIVGGYYQRYHEDRYADYAFLFGGAFFSRDAVQSVLGDNTGAVFGDVTYKIVPTCSAFGGIRFTHEKLSLDYGDKVFTGPYDAATNVITYLPTAVTAGPTENRSDNNVSGRVGMQWQPTPVLNYYASINRGYKGAAADESHGAASTPYGQRLIKPEIATSYEIGAKQRFFNDRLSLDVAFYDEKVDNIQQVAAVPDSIIQHLINAGNLKSRGAELTTRLRVSRELSFDGNLAYIDAKYQGGLFLCNASQTPGVPPCTVNGNMEQSLDGQPAIGVPKVKYVLGANYDGRLSAGLRIFGRVSYLWRSRIQYALAQDPITVEPISQQLDASLGVGSMDGRWEVSLFGKNLTNHLFYTQLTTSDGFIERLGGYLGRDFKRYGGIQVKVHF